MRTKTSKNTNIVVRQYNKKGHTDTLMTIKDFIKNYKVNVNNAFINWSISNEESLPISIIGDTEDQTYRNMFKYFLKDFCINFNTNAYIGYIHKIDNREGYCYCKCFTDTQSYEQVVKELPYVHVLQA